MKVHLIRRQSIEEYAARNARSKSSFNIWLAILKFADWSNANDITQTFGSADLLGQGCDRVVFNVGGNIYRMICHYHFGAHEVHLYVNWIGTHGEYTRLCRDGEQYTVDMY